MKYTVEMGLSAMMFIPSFIHIGSDIEKLITGIHRQHGDRMSLLRKVGLWNHLAVCQCVCVTVCLSPPMKFECLNQSLRNLVCISWHLSPSQRCTS
jgi:hypothetical protein